MPERHWVGGITGDWREAANWTMNNADGIHGFTMGVDPAALGQGAVYGQWMQRPPPRPGPGPDVGLIPSDTRGMEFSVRELIHKAIGGDNIPGRNSE